MRHGNLRPHKTNRVLSLLAALLTSVALWIIALLAFGWFWTLAILAVTGAFAAFLAICGYAFRNIDKLERPWWAE